MKPKTRHIVPRYDTFLGKPFEHVYDVNCKCLPVMRVTYEAVLCVHLSMDDRENPDNTPGNGKGWKIVELNYGKTGI